MSTCIHGYEQGQCLICSTLSTGSKDAAPGRRTRRRERSGSGRDRIAAGPVDVVDRPGLAARHGATGTHLLIGIVVVILAIVGFWILAGVVFAVLRLAEILIVGVVAGAVGYRLGRARGRRER